MKRFGASRKLKVRDLYTQAMTWSFMDHVITNSDIQFNSTEREAATKPALIGADFQEWNLDYVLKTRSILIPSSGRRVRTYKRVRKNVDEETGEIAISETDTDVVFCRFLGTGSRFKLINEYLNKYINGYVSKNKDHTIRHRLGEGNPLLKSLSNSDPLVETELLLSCLYALSDEVTEEGVFIFGDVEFLLSGSELIKSRKGQKVQSYPLQGGDWNTYLSNPRRGYRRLSVFETAIYQAAKTIDTEGFRRFTDTVMHIGDKNLIRVLAHSTPETLKKEGRKKDFNLIAEILNAENFGEKLRDLIDFTDLDKSKVERQGTFELNGPLTLERKLTALTDLRRLNDPGKLKGDSNVIRFFGKSWEW